jgi:hypothetical protein
VGLKQVYPNSVVPFFYSLVFPFIDLQPGLYWTSDENTGGQVTFSFNNLQQGANTTKYNFYHGAWKAENHQVTRISDW